MTNWQNKIRLKHFYTNAEDHHSVQTAMNAIADELDKALFFRTFLERKKFRSIPKGDETFGPVDYANRLLDRMYDFADDNRIWIE